MAEESDWTLYDRWKAGDQEAATILFRRYASNLMAFIQARLGGAMQRRFDQEDIVMSAFESFFSGIQESKFQKKRDQVQSLWAILAAIALTKLKKHLRHHSQNKRALANEFYLIDGLCPSDLLDYAKQSEPSPQEAEAVVSEILAECWTNLSPRNQEIVRLFLYENFTVEEIGKALKHSDFPCGERTVRRVLEGFESSLRKKLFTETDPDGDQQV